MGAPSQQNPELPSPQEEDRFADTRAFLAALERSELDRRIRETEGVAGAFQSGQRRGEALSLDDEPEEESGPQPGGPKGPRRPNGNFDAKVSFNESDVTGRRRTGKNRQLGR